MQINKIQVKDYKGSSFLKQSDKLSKKPQSFNGVGDLLTAGLQTFDKYPMIGVSFVDTVSTNIPRTVVDLKTGIPAALETARREFSGLFVNCLMPSFIVLGVAKGMNKGFQKKFPGINMANSWANQASIDFLSPIYKNAKHAASQPEEIARAFARETLSRLEGLDGKTWVKFSDKLGTENFEKAVDSGVKKLLTSSTTSGQRRPNRGCITLPGKMGGSESVLPPNTKPDFIVTPEGTIMDTSKNYNLVGSGLLFSVPLTRF